MSLAGTGGVTAVGALLSAWTSRSSRSSGPSGYRRRSAGRPGRAGSGWCGRFGRPSGIRQRFREAPRILFLWIDRIFADLARDGGLPQMNLSPPDFAVLHERKEAETEDP
ncbi:MAG: protein-export chaperone SecB [Gammaproteobacteria bacterium]|nr:protein-export chaperone SecB [Gammaproteobacteria bacterium]